MDRRAFMRLSSYAAGAALIGKATQAAAQSEEKVAEPTAAARSSPVAPGGVQQ